MINRHITFIGIILMGVVCLSLPAHASGLKFDFREGSDASPGRCTVVVDGTTYAQDEEGIESAITAAGVNGTVCLADGTYNLTADDATGIQNFTAGSKVIGGPGAIIFHAQDGGNTWQMAADDQIIEGFTIDGDKDNRGATTFIGVRITGARATVRDMYIHDTYDSCIYTDGQGTTIHGNRLIDCVLDSFASSSRGAIVSANGGDDTIITNNYIEDSSMGIRVQGGGEGIVIDGNFIRDIDYDTSTGGSSCFHVGNVQSFILSNNSCVDTLIDTSPNDNGINCMYIDQDSASQTFSPVTGNMCYNVSGVGLELQGGRVVATGNMYFLTNDGVGAGSDDQNCYFFGSDVDDIILNGEYCQNPANDGIRIQSGESSEKTSERFIFSNIIIKDVGTHTTRQSGHGINFDNGATNTIDNVHISNIIIEDTGPGNLNDGIHKNDTGDINCLTYGGYIRITGESSEKIDSALPTSCVTDPAEFIGGGELIIGIEPDVPGVRISTDGSAVFNEQGNDSTTADWIFRVESDTHTDAISVDGASGGVTLGNLATGGAAKCVQVDSNGGLSTSSGSCGSGSGETNDGVNVGTGSQIFKSKTGLDLQFRTIVSGDNVTTVMADNTMTLNVSSIPSSDVTGVFEVANGGTGRATFVDGSVLLGNGTDSITSTGVLAKGVLLVGDGSGNPTELPVGTDGFILSADSAEASGVKWIVAPTPGGGGTVTVSVQSLDSAQVSTTSTVEQTFGDFVLTANTLDTNNALRFTANGTLSESSATGSFDLKVTLGSTSCTASIEQADIANGTSYGWKFNGTIGADGATNAQIANSNVNLVQLSDSEAGSMLGEATTCNAFAEDTTTNLAVRFQSNWSNAPTTFTVDHVSVELLEAP